MADRSEISELESQNHRQFIKINYLQQEVKQLQEYVQDLEQIIKLNKEALRIATSTGTIPQPNNRMKLATSTTGNESSNRSDEYTIENKNLQAVNVHLQQENTRLYHIIDKVTRERNVAQSKALINEQICEEAQRRESEANNELQQRVIDMRKTILDKEEVIHELEKIKPVVEEDTFITIYKEVSVPTELMIKLHEEVENLTRMLSKASQDIAKIQGEKDELKSLNITLSAELQKLVMKLSNPVHTNHKGFGMSLKHANEGDTLNLSAFVGQSDSSSEEIDQIPSPLPDKVQMKNILVSKAPIPKLDLSKAKQIQEYQAKKSTLQQQQTEQKQTNTPDPKLQEKLQKLTEEVEKTKKNLAKEMVNNRLLTEQINDLRRQNRELVFTNETLIRANKRYEEKWQKIFYTLEFYKEFYYKYVEVVAARHQPSKSLMMSNLDKFKNLARLKEKFNIDEKELTADQMIKHMKKIDEENGRQNNVSILEAEEIHLGGNFGHDEKAQGDFSLDYCKTYLKQLAQDVDKKLQRKKQENSDDSEEEKGEEHPVKDIVVLKRSMSNPLDYMDQKKQLMFDQGGLLQLVGSHSKKGELVKPPARTLTILSGKDKHQQ